MSVLQAGRAHWAQERTQRLFWTFLDQGVVSAGAFIVQIALARLLSQHDYGVFTLIFSGLLTLQLVNATLLYYPMSVSIPKEGAATKPALLCASLVLVMSMSLVLAVLLATTMAAFGQYDALLPALVYLLAWQAQEGLRRGLFGELRHRAAIPGDVVTYLVPAGAIAGSALAFGMSIPGALSIMAACAAIGACLHARCLTLARPSAAEVRAVARSFWRIGGLPSLGNGFLYHTRLMMIPWGLALYAGPAASAGFQAAMNIVSLSNPLMLGLGNLLPQIVAGVRHRGLDEAWRVARIYTFIAMLPVLIYSLLVCLWPVEVLWFFYGSGSAYLGLDLPLRLLLITGLIGFYVEAVLGFLHGASLVGSAAEVNLYGTLSVLLLALPAILIFGLVGGCAALLAGNLIRLGRAQLALARTQSRTYPAVA